MDAAYDKCDSSQLGFSPEHLTWDDSCYGKCADIARKAGLHNRQPLPGSRDGPMPIAYGYWNKAQANHSTPFILYDRKEKYRYFVPQGWTTGSTKEGTKTIFNLSFMDASGNFVDGLDSIAEGTATRSFSKAN